VVVFIQQKSQVFLIQSLTTLQKFFFLIYRHSFRSDHWFIVFYVNVFLYLSRGCLKSIFGTFSLLIDFKYTNQQSAGLAQVHCAAHQARMEVAHVELSCTWTSSPECSHLDLLQLSLLQSLGLGSSVLEPNFHLRLGESERRGELGPLGDAQVLLLAELFLEREELLGGEWRAGLSVWFVLAEVTF
jgi:hypothetical protein